MAFLYMKLASLTIVLLGNFLAGISPYFILKALRKNDFEELRKNRVSALLIFFGGGVFMSTCFLELLPRASEEYEKYFHTQCVNEAELNKTTPQTKQEGHKDGFPIPEMIILCGFFLAFAMEEITHFAFSSFRNKSLQGTNTPFCSCSKRQTECSKTFKTDDPVEQTLFSLEDNINESEKEENSSDCLIIKRRGDTVNDTEVGLLQPSILSQDIPNYGTLSNTSQQNENQSVPLITSPLVFDKNINVILRLDSSIIDHISLSTYLLLAMSLTIYNIFEGIFIGQLSDFFTWMHLIHYTQQFIIAFVVGGAISVNSENFTPVMCFVGILSITCPFGVLLTMSLTNALSSISLLSKAITNCILCGFFLYITFFDLLRSNLVHNASSLGKFIIFALGFASVASLQYGSIVT